MPSPNSFTLGYVGRTAQVNTSKFTVEEVDLSDVIPKIKQGHASHGYSPKSFQMTWPYGYPRLASEAGQARAATGQAAATKWRRRRRSRRPDRSDRSRSQSTKGPSAEGYINYNGGNQNHPFASPPSDPRHQLILQDKQDQQQGGQQGGVGQSTGGQSGSGQQEDNGGREGDVVMYGLRSKTGPTQIHISNFDEGEGEGKLKPGAYVSTRTKNHIKLQLVEVKDDDESGGGGGGSTAGAMQTGGGQQAGGGQNQGQRPLLKKKSETFVHITKDAITITRGNCSVIVEGDKITCQHGDKTKSMVVDSSHTHIKHGSNAIFVDNAGCWSTKQIEIKADPD